MKREKELVKNTIVLALGKFLPRLVTLVTLPIVTARLSKNDYGTYDLIMTLVMLLMPVATLQIQSAAFRFLIDCRDDKNKCKEIITNIFGVTLFVSSIISVIFLIFVNKMNIVTRAIVVFYFIADIMYNTISQVSRGLGKNKIYSVSAIVLSIINGFGVVILVELFSFGLNGVILSLSFADIVAFIFIAFSINVFQFINLKKINSERVKEMLAYSWPMVPNNLSTWVLKLSDRLVITAFLGIESNAVYAVANKIPNLLLIAQSIFVMAWQENASLAVNDKDAEKYYSDMFDTMFSLMIGFTGALIACTPIMFKLLIKGNYEDAYLQMPILILGMFFYCMSAFQGGIYIAHKKTKSVGITTVVAAIINLMVDFMLINFIGITAGSLSSLVAYLVLYIYRMWDINKIQPIRYDLKKQIIYIFIMIVMLLLCSLRNKYINVINIFVSIVVFLLVNRKLIINTLKYGSKKIHKTI